jgi:hypothetical protein
VFHIAPPLHVDIRQLATRLLMKRTTSIKSQIFIVFQNQYELSLIHAWKANNYQIESSPPEQIQTTPVPLSTNCPTCQHRIDAENSKPQQHITAIASQALYNDLISQHTGYLSIPVENSTSTVTASNASIYKSIDMPVPSLTAPSLNLSFTASMSGGKETSSDIAVVQQRPPQTKEDELRVQQKSDEANQQSVVPQSITGTTKLSSVSEEPTTDLDNMSNYNNELTTIDKGDGAAEQKVDVGVGQQYFENQTGGTNEPLVDRNSPGEPIELDRHQQAIEQIEDAYYGEKIDNTDDFYPENATHDSGVPTTNNEFDFSENDNADAQEFAVSNDKGNQLVSNNEQSVYENNNDNNPNYGDVINPDDGIQSVLETNEPTNNYYNNDSNNKDNNDNSNQSAENNPTDNYQNGNYGNFEEQQQLASQPPQEQQEVPSNNYGVVQDDQVLESQEVNQTNEYFNETNTPVVSNQMDENYHGDVTSFNQNYSNDAYGNYVGNEESYGAEQQQDQYPNDNNAYYNGNNDGSGGNYYYDGQQQEQPPEQQQQLQQQPTEIYDNMENSNYEYTGYDQQAYDDQTGIETGEAGDVNETGDNLYQSDPNTAAMNESTLPAGLLG